MTVTHIKLVISHDSDGLVGSEGWGEFDAAASLEELKRQTARALHEKFGCPVEVADDLNDRVYVTTDKDQDTSEDEGAVWSIYNDVWSDWGWLVA